MKMAEKFYLPHPRSASLPSFRLFAYVRNPLYMLLSLWFLLDFFTSTSDAGFSAYKKRQFPVLPLHLQAFLLPHWQPSHTDSPFHRLIQEKRYFCAKAEDSPRKPLFSASKRVKSQLFGEISSDKPLLHLLHQQWRGNLPHKFLQLEDSILYSRKLSRPHTHTPFGSSCKDTPSSSSHTHTSSSDYVKKFAAHTFQFLHFTPSSSLQSADFLRRRGFTSSAARNWGVRRGVNPFEGVASLQSRVWGKGRRRVQFSRLHASLEDDEETSETSNENEAENEESLSPQVFHRLLSAFSYVLPLIDTLQGFLVPIMLKFPESKGFLAPINYALSVYSSIPMLSFGVFSGTYMAFVRKNIFEVPYFVRYNIMQALILSMFQYATTMIFFRIFPFNHLEESPVTDVMMLTVLLSGFGMIFNSFFTSLLGKYPTIPVISEAVNMHIGDKPADEP